MTELSIRPEEIRDALDGYVQNYRPETATREEVGTVSDAADGADAIATSVGAVAAGVGQTRSAVANTTAAAQELSQRATDLQSLVGRFRY